jgi:hypothetical protein
MTSAGTVRNSGDMAKGSDQRAGTELTLLFWQHRTSNKLSPEDARQMIENVAGFFSQLSSWDHQAASQVNGHRRDAKFTEIRGGRKATTNQR